MGPDRPQRDRPAVSCYRPAVFSLHVILISLSYQQNKNPERVSKVSLINLLEPELFIFFNFSTPVYKMWIIQKPNKLELWNKLHFEEEKTESIYHV